MVNALLPNVYRLHEADLVRGAEGWDLRTYDGRSGLSKLMVRRWADTRMATLKGMADALEVPYGPDPTHDALLYDVVSQWTRKKIAEPVFTVGDEVALKEPQVESRACWDIEQSPIKVTDVRSNGNVEIRKITTYTAVISPEKIKKAER